MFLLLMMLLLIPSGCIVGPFATTSHLPPPSPKITLQTTFDAAATKEQLRPGDNTISGAAFLKLDNGGIATAAGRTIRLVPVNAYSTEWVSHWFYGNTQRGYLQAYMDAPQFADIPQEFYELQKTTIADAKGEFSFKKLADGEYFAMVDIIWTVRGERYNEYGNLVSDNYKTGGTLCQRVSVSGGEVQEIILTQ